MKIKRLKLPDRSTVLTAAGLGWLAAAAWLLHIIAGVAAVGIALVVLAVLVEES